jgi:hypothetical protein
MIRRALVLLAVVLFPLPGCKKPPPPVAGGACKPSDHGAVVCPAPDSALECRDGTWTAVPCRGPGGCRASTQTDPRGPSQTASCDDSIAKEGEPCVRKARNEHEDQACAVEKDRSLVCDAGRWVLGRRCRGPKGCSGSYFDCDTTIAVEGEPCYTQAAGSHACGVDRKTRLECASPGEGQKHPLGMADGYFVVKSTCPGKTGCEVRGLGGDPDLPRPFCLLADASAGDDCGESTDLADICSADRSAVIRCDPETWKFAVKTKCTPPQTCKPTVPVLNPRCK